MSWFSNLLGGKNPADAAMPYIDQIPGRVSPYINPFFDAGKGALGPLQEQYAKLLKDPGALMNQMGQSYQQSPGFKSAMEQAMQAGGHAAAAGGMAGTPQHQFQDMKMATDLSNQDYGNYMKNVLGLYGQGLSGEQGMAGMGQQAGQSMADIISQALAQQGNLAFAGQSQKNQNQNNWWNNIFKGAGAMAGFNPWGMFGNI